MGSIQGRTGWCRHSVAFAAAAIVAGFQLFSSPVFAAYELPPGERITNLPAIPRNMPQKEAYENYDPVIGRNFDIKNFWMRGDMRVRPEWRNGVCFGGTPGALGACNQSVGGKASGPGANNTFVQQWARLGIGYDLSPDVNFYVELIYSHDWGTSGNPNNAGAAGGPALNNNCNTNNTGQCSLGVRAAYMLVRNLGDVKGLSLKAGRQYLVFGNQSLLGHFDWANTGFSHDGFMFNYSGNKNFETWLGWFREADLNIGEAASTGSFSAAPANSSKNQAQMVVFYNQIKSIPGVLIEPHYILWENSLPTNSASATGVTGVTAAAGNVAGIGSNVGVWVPKSANQIRHTVGNRIEVRKGNFDFIDELEYQFGQMASGQLGTGSNNGTNRNVHINAWATRNWLGYTIYESKWKPRFAVGFDYASGDGNANCNAPGSAGTTCTTGNTFENLYPTNHIHMGYMDVMAWKNMLTPAANIQFRPSARDHFEIWYNNFNLASARDNWYRGSQTVYVFSRNNNTAKHIGDELDFTWTRMFADGKVALQASYAYMWSGDYIRQNLGTNANQQWAYASLWVNF